MNPAPSALFVEPRLDFHPYRATFVLSRPVLANDEWRTFENGSALEFPARVQALLSVPGVASVSLHRNRVVLVRDPEASWETLLPAVQDALQGEFAGREPLTAGELPQESAG
ncbi:MAG: NifU N-terminal domain-containing protein [Planctomycetota bacterium]